MTEINYINLLKCGARATHRVITPIRKPVNSSKVRILIVLFSILAFLGYFVLKVF